MDEAIIAQGFWRAAYGEIAWETAIDAIASPFDCRSGQIVVIDRDAGLIGSVLSRVTAQEVRGMERYGVGDPATNPRILGLVHAAAGRAITDDDIVSANDRHTLPIYRDFFTPTGTDAAILIRSPDAIDAPTIAVSLLTHAGSAANGRAARSLLERVMPAITDAARLAVRFGRMQANAMVEALDQHRRPCIALRRDMVPTAISPASESLLSSGDYLTMRHGRLHACHRDSDRTLRAIVERIAGLDAAAMRRHPLALHASRPDQPPIVASLAPVPSRAALSDTCVLLTLPDRAAPDDLSQLLADLYHLTPTEAAIALAIAGGQGPTQIAASRGQSRETVRTHVRAILAKTDTHRQSELAALIGRLQR